MVKQISAKNKSLALISSEDLFERALKLTHCHCVLNKNENWLKLITLYP